MPSSETHPSKVMRLFAFCVIACCVVAFDQVTKASVRSSLGAVGTSAPFIPGLIKLELVENTGAAFSMGEGGAMVFALIAALIAIAAGVYVTVEDVPWYVIVPLACVAGGGVGNMIDRLTVGYVTDFFATTFVDFPVFNVADIFVTCGIAVSLIALLANDRKRDSEGDDGGHA